MATQFQQRLIGTVIIVAIGVIFLPDLLSGKKQLEPDEAVTIPLRPQLDAVEPAITAPPRPGTEAAGRAAEAAAQVAAAAEQLAAQQQTASEPVQAVAEVWTIEQAQEAPPVAPKPAPQPVQQVAQQPVVQQIAPQPVAQQPAPQPVVQQAPPQRVPQPVAQQPAVQQVAPQPVAPAPQPVAQPRLVAGQIQQIEPRQATPQPVQQAAPQPVSQAPVSQGGEFVVQLGAFQNAANVNALVQKLRAAGYNAQTTPSPAREGEINRVWVGPSSKATLESQLPALQRLTGLNGSVRPK